MNTNNKFKKARSYMLTQRKLRDKALVSGVELIAPDTIFLSSDTSYGKNIIIEPYVIIGSKVKIADNVTIKSFSHLEGVIINKNSIIGPYARLRPGTILKENSKVGNFVEVKNSVLGSNTKASHLSYIGDAQIGKNVNIGAGTITCNYDGVKKNKTKVSDNVLIGSNSSLVAPIKIDKNSVIGAGSVITKKVKKGSLALTRSAQIEIKNYKKRNKK